MPPRWPCKRHALFHMFLGYSFFDRHLRPCTKNGNPSRIEVKQADLSFTFCVFKIPGDPARKNISLSSPCTVESNRILSRILVRSSSINRPGITTGLNIPKARGARRESDSPDGDISLCTGFWVLSFRPSRCTVNRVAGWNFLH